MLLPAMALARAYARRTVCMNNMRQLGLASMLYASDFELFPPLYYNTWDPALINRISQPWNNYGVALKVLVARTMNGRISNLGHLWEESFVSENEFYCPSNNSPAQHYYYKLASYRPWPTTNTNGHIRSSYICVHPLRPVRGRHGPRCLGPERPRSWTPRNGFPTWSASIGRPGARALACAARQPRPGAESLSRDECAYRKSTAAGAGQVATFRGPVHSPCVHALRPVRGRHGPRCLGPERPRSWTPRPNGPIRAPSSRRRICVGSWIGGCTTCH